MTPSVGFPMNPQKWPGKQRLRGLGTSSSGQHCMPRLSFVIFAPLYKVTMSFTSKPYLEIPLQMLCLGSLSQIPLIFQFPGTLELCTWCQFEPAQNNQCINSTQRQ